MEKQGWEEKGEKMDIAQADAIMQETHKGYKHTASYSETLGAVKAKITERLRHGKEESSSSLYACTGGNFNVMINVAMFAIRQMVESGEVIDRHEMVDGYISTHFYKLAI